jgi:hypothetical protein
LRWPDQTKWIALFAIPFPYQTIDEAFGAGEELWIGVQNRLGY